MLVLAICLSPTRRAFISVIMVGLNGTGAIDRGTALCTCGRTRPISCGGERGGAVFLGSFPTASVATGSAGARSLTGVMLSLSSDAHDWNGLPEASAAGCMKSGMKSGVESRATLGGTAVGEDEGGRSTWGGAATTTADRGRSGRAEEDRARLILEGMEGILAVGILGAWHR